MKQFITILKRAVTEFLEDDCMSSGAAIAYYSIFALPPLMVVVFGLATRFGVSEEQLNDVVTKQLGMPDMAAATAGKGADSRQAPMTDVAEHSSSSSGIGFVGRVEG